MTKRYEVRDQNGDVLYQTDAWSLAVLRYMNWLPNHMDPSLFGAGIWDNQDHRWQSRYVYKEQD